MRAFVRGDTRCGSLRTHTHALIQGTFQTRRQITQEHGNTLLEFDGARTYGAGAHTDVYGHCRRGSAVFRISKRTLSGALVYESTKKWGLRGTPCLRCGVPGNSR